MLWMKQSPEVIVTAPEIGPEFEDLFRNEYLRLAKALYLLTGDRSEAEELAQEAMARIYERWSRIRAMDSPTGYLYRTALNLSRRRFERIRRERQTALIDRGEDPVEGTDRRLMVRAAVRDLSREQREALVLLEWLDLTPQEAGVVLGVSAGAVRARAHRARVDLRARLGGTDE
jgi:RNA polymerase sigma-70 factor (ECF subfamily)